MNRRLTLGYSTCPNDTFLFYALAHGLIFCGDITFDTVLEDVETLNQSAEQERLDVTKLSFAALGHLRERYGLLRSGAALGRGCGPLIVARPGFDPARLQEVSIAVPGLHTTACLLLGLYLGKEPDMVPMTFDRIMPAVASGDCEAGVIIHEGRFTYPDHGLVCLTDLGQWWETETGLPIPLGCIAIRRSLGTETALTVETAIRESVIYAAAHPEAAAGYIRTHAQEMAPDVIRQHIDLYVNAFTRDLGDEGEAAVRGLFRRAAAAGLIPESDAPLFAG